MTSNPADVQDIVERLGWHYEHVDTGEFVLRNPDGPEAADEIERLRAALQQSRSAVALNAIINVRAANAGNLKRSGAVWEAYDRAVLDCHDAVTAALSQESAG